MNKRLNVQKFDQMRKKIRKQNMYKKYKGNKVVSIMTYCQCCKNHTIKKNKVNHHYLCDECYSLTPKESYLQLKDGSNNKTPQYINWEDDLEFLYQHFWLDEDKFN